MSIKKKLLVAIIVLIAIIAIPVIFIIVDSYQPKRMSDVISYMEYLNKNKYTGENCYYDESIDKYDKKIGLGQNEILDCLANSKPTIRAEGFPDGEPRIHVRYECSFKGHTGYRDMYYDFESDSCSIGWRD